MPLGRQPSKRALANISKLKKTAKVVGSVAAATNLWKAGSMERAAARRMILSKPYVPPSLFSPSPNTNRPSLASSYCSTGTPKSTSPHPLAFTPSLVVHLPKPCSPPLAKPHPSLSFSPHSPSSPHHRARTHARNTHTDTERNETTVQTDNRASARTDEELLLLEEILVRMKFVSTLSLEKRMDLCRIMGHMGTPGGTTVFRQGDLGDTFYVILHGSVNVLIKDPVTEADNVVATLYGGDSFGELALLQEGNQRAASIVTRDDCEFLTIGRDDYNGILRDVSESAISEKVTFLKELSLFKTVPYSTVQSVAYVLTVRDYPRNAVVVKQGSECEDMFFIVNGGVKLVREIEDRSLLRANGVLSDGPGSLLERNVKIGRGGMDAVPPAPPGFGEGDSELLESPDMGQGYLSPMSGTGGSPDESSMRRGGSGGGPMRMRSRAGGTMLGEYADTSELQAMQMLQVNVGDSVPIGSYDIEDSPVAPGTAGGALPHSPSTSSPRIGKRLTTSVIDTGRGSPSNRSDAAYQAGLGRLFLEVGTQGRCEYFGDTMLTRKAKQVVSTITTTSTRCYVLNRWDLLRRVDKSFIEHVQSEQAQRTAMSSNDRALIREFQRLQEWIAYKKGLVDGIIEVKEATKAIPR